MKNNNPIEFIDFNLAHKLSESVGVSDCRKTDWKEFLYSITPLCQIEVDWSLDVNTIVSAHSKNASISENIFNQNTISF